MSTQYELQANRIETVFQAHHVPARVWQATVTPRFVRFDITTALGTRLQAAEKLDEELAMALGVQAVRVYRDGGVIRVEVPRDTPREVKVAALMGRLDHVPAMTGLLGIDSDGAPLMLRMDSPDVAHVLIAGTTGSGKTALQRTLLVTLAMHNRPGALQMILIDPKGRGLEPLAGLPHMWQGLELISEPSEAALALAALVAEMERRDRQRTRLPHIILAIDELADLITTGGAPVTAALTRLTQRGREAGIHVVAATQRPAAALVGGLVKANFPVRLVGSVTSADDARVATGMSGSDAERLMGRGDFLLVCRGQTLRFQAAYASDAELRRLAGLAAVGAPERRTRHWTSAALSAAAQLTDRATDLFRLRRTASDLAVGLGGDLNPTQPADNGLGGPAQPNPTQPNPTGDRRSLRERYTDNQIRSTVAEYDGNLSDASRALYGYKDAATMALLRTAMATQQETDHV